MKKKHLLYVTILFFSYCSSPVKEEKSSIIGSWKLLEVKTPNQENSEKSSKSNKLILHMFPDSTYTELEGYKTRSGKWSSLKENHFKYGNTKLVIEKEDKVNNSLLVNIYNEKENLESKLKLVEAEKVLKDYKEDPFYPDNNKWRQKPSRKETNEEIRARLLNYMLHYAYVLKASIERNSEKVSFAHSTGIIKLYQVGIGILPKNKIKTPWINCFYDHDDAMKAFYLFKSYLDEDGVFKGTSTGDWVKDDFDILMTLHSKIKRKLKANSEKFTE
ncbi:hypothetical protein [uncultured Lacinutrix sp.]|uniref:hypothetical protein n=1 Tax=uncultured Lacinutrix sp. TaxID=574032 RepID=UPI002605C89A|nr:hypothetical protein [uncultured Lacinutrix sp.]